jgi:hypothetical protein
MCCKEQRKSLLCRPSSLLACQWFTAAWASGPVGLVQRVVHGVEQRQIAQLGTTVNVALRKNISAHHHFFRLTSKL